MHKYASQTTPSAVSGISRARVTRAGHPETHPVTGLSVARFDEARPKRWVF